MKGVTVVTDKFVLDDDNLWPDNALTDRQTDRRPYQKRLKKAVKRFDLLRKCRANTTGRHL